MRYRDPIEQAMFSTGKSRLEILEKMRDALLASELAKRDARTPGAIAKLERAIDEERKVVECFKSAVSKMLYDRYVLGDGTEVKGQSLTFVQKNLRDDGWRGLSAWRLEDRLKSCGFKTSRGRGYRIYHGGVRKLGVECSVIHQ